MATILEPIAEAGRVRRDLLPQRRVLVRFDFATVTGPGGRGWVLIEHGNAEICEKHAGFEEDLVVVVNDPWRSRWHLGQIEWREPCVAKRSASPAIEHWPGPAHMGQARRPDPDRTVARYRCSCGPTAALWTSVASFLLQSFLLQPTRHHPNWITGAHGARQRSRPGTADAAAPAVPVADDQGVFEQVGRADAAQPTHGKPGDGADVRCGAEGHPDAVRNHGYREP